MRLYIPQQRTIMVIIKFNNSNLGKRWISELYLDWELERTHPYDRLTQIRLKGFTLREIKWLIQNYKTN